MRFLEIAETPDLLDRSLLSRDAIVAAFTILLA